MWSRSMAYRDRAGSADSNQTLCIDFIRSIISNHSKRFEDVAVCANVVAFRPIGHSPQGRVQFVQNGLHI